MPYMKSKNLAQSDMRTRTNSPRSGGGRAGARDKMTKTNHSMSMKKPTYAPKNVSSGSSNPNDMMRRTMKGKDANKKVSGKFPRKGY